MRDSLKVESREFVIAGESREKEDRRSIGDSEALILGKVIFARESNKE